jgi:hypothetical protein
MQIVILQNQALMEAYSKVMRRIIAGKAVRRTALIFNLRFLIDFPAFRQNLTFETASLG